MTLPTPGLPWPTPDLAPAATLSLLRTQTDRMLDAIRSLDDDAMREPSTLPDWTRGHLLTHVARNAGAVQNLCAWARTGDETPMYASRDKRAADIEAGSTRSADELIADVEKTAKALALDLEVLPQRRWLAEVRHGGTGDAKPAWWIPMMRLGEIELHHVDLNVGYEPVEWPSAWVRNTLPDAAHDLERQAGEPLSLEATDVELRVGADDARTVSGPTTDLLAWVTGRSNGSALTISAGKLPKLGEWR
ncbi:maleylpyruvate isomerase family mycothiol-dependent enzyme [Solicola gregarius]|uniref:Maleylpyruvate isomerase family mycothiol-dependent enzyme n=1 Tax=Solicola gregarius TaxID=2908642 RepID=A0AA46YKS2_9ACTN|nr:maleylpyruvate isomerase family mycothiol-dependent enzyme [Solicola gregarius]UYM04889.1 maleylpyruvate isomerase family mycothiol-dependent enzyme [Solicola gregarius]